VLALSLTVGAKSIDGGWKEGQLFTGRKLICIRPASNYMMKDFTNRWQSAGAPGRSGACSGRQSCYLSYSGL